MSVISIGVKGGSARITLGMSYPNADGVDRDDRTHGIITVTHAKENAHGKKRQGKRRLSRRLRGSVTPSCRPLLGRRLGVTEEPLDLLGIHLRQRCSVEMALFKMREEGMLLPVKETRGKIPDMVLIDQRLDVTDHLEFGHQGERSGSRRVRIVSSGYDRDERVTARLGDTGTIEEIREGGLSGG